MSVSSSLRSFLSVWKNHEDSKPKPSKHKGASAGPSATLMQCLPALLPNTHSHSKVLKKHNDILDSIANKNQRKITQLPPSIQAACKSIQVSHKIPILFDSSCPVITSYIQN